MQNPELTRAALAAMIDHTLLHVEAGEKEIEQLCRDAQRENFASVCIHPYWLEVMAPRFPHVRFCTVIGFPLGMQTVKLHEAQHAVQAGAVELDIVVNHAFIVAKNWKAISEELESFRHIFPEIGLKFIIETCRLQDEETVKLTELASHAGFDWIKTSTGFAASGARVEDVALMKAHAGSRMQVKASGGIRNLKAAEEMIVAGARRIGTSAGLQILAEFDARIGS
ncbi:MAG: deoxyribose-phosphate aldolase [Proteobacteria bacterium]|nr:MAG: deoxyribose-phosphate aldolase [Pseudomonadota bacterium]